MCEGLLQLPTFTKLMIHLSKLKTHDQSCLQIPAGPPEAGGEDGGTVPVCVPPGGAVSTEATLRTDPQSDGGQSYIHVKVIARVCFYIQNSEP